MRKSKIYSLRFLEVCFGSVSPEVKAAASSAYEDAERASSPSVRLYIRPTPGANMMKLVKGSGGKTKSYRDLLIEPDSAGVYE